MPNNRKRTARHDEPRRLRVIHLEAIPAAQRERVYWQGIQRAALGPTLERAAAQQRGNEARRAVDDGWLADASARHLAGEPWKVIAADYSISERRLREHMRKAGLPTRGRRYC
jgi:hypothetical protein